MYSLSKDREKIAEILSAKREERRKEEDRLEQQFRDLLEQARQQINKDYFNH